MKITKIGVVAAALAAAALPVAASAAPLTYAVSVTTNFGTQFDDCFTFKGAYLFIAGLSARPLITTAAPTTPKYYYTSVATLPLVEDFGTTIAFTGFKTGNAQSGTISAVGASGTRGSYTVTGTAVQSCTANAKTRTNNWKRISH